MKPSAVLLIDLENFYCSREDYCRPGPAPNYDRTRFGYDLEKLLGFVRAMVDPLPFTVRRAYANFNASRYERGAPQYYLRNIPDELLRQGVEPVQVFRLSAGSGRGSKNAADMRMAMDATALLHGAGHVEHFVLVTGDADFIPVILELKRHGHTVSVIGVTGATNELIQSFVDNFELFEDLLIAEEVEGRSREATDSGDEIAKVAVAVRKLLHRSRPVRFAALKPLLTKELGHPFDPGLFGCDTTGDFLRKHQATLGIVIRPALNDQEIDLPGSVPGVNGSTGSKPAQRPAARGAERQPAKATSSVEPHAPTHYRQLLTLNGPATSVISTVRVPAVPWPILVWCCDAVIPALTPPTGSPTTSILLLPRLSKAAKDAGIPELEKSLTLVYPVLRAALPVPAADGVYTLPAATTGEHIRRGMLRYIIYVLNCRLTESGVSGPIRPEALAAMFDPGPATEQVTAEIVAALAEPAPTPAPTPPASSPTKAPTRVEEIHTPAGYQKLLKCGGPKGSDTEQFRVQPVPWPSVERVCADAFTLLSPAAGAPLSRSQFVARLMDAGKELCIDKYDQHVRRSVGMLRLAGALDDESDPVKLHPDLTESWQVRAAVLETLLNLLCIRLEERGIAEPIQPRAFVAAIEAGPLTEPLLPEITRAIESMYEHPLTSDAEEQTVEVVAEPPASDAEIQLGVAEETTAEPVPAEENSIEIVSPEPAANPASLAEANVTIPLEPDWDPYSFDGTLPDSSAPHTSAEELPAATSGVLDVATVTSEAVAGNVATAEPDFPLQPGPVAASPIEQPVPQPAEEEAELVVFAPPVELANPPESEPPLLVEDDLPLAVPVMDWLPETAPPFAHAEYLTQRIADRIPSANLRVPTPPPVPKGEGAAPVAKITPPPLPPLPPESA